jgi:hypothetical protein
VPAARHVARYVRGCDWHSHSPAVARVGRGGHGESGQSPCDLCRCGAHASIAGVADARTWGPAPRARVVCARRLPDGARCDRKLDQGPPWEYQVRPGGGLWMRFPCDRCGADHQPPMDAFTAAVAATLRRPGSQREIRLPLSRS